MTKDLAAGIVASNFIAMAAFFTALYGRPAVIQLMTIVVACSYAIVVLEP